MGGNALCTDELSLGGRPAGRLVGSCAELAGCALGLAGSGLAGLAVAGWPHPGASWRCYRLYNYA